MIGKFGSFEYALADRYRFEEELGRGAMGTVYRVHDLRLQRDVAIKMLHPLLTNELGVGRFQSEIRIAASLHHPSIVSVHESGEADHRLFYAMDYLGGETLRARMQREKQLGIEDALRIVDQVAAGLQYAHDHAIVHRDVKPENILLADGRACIVDFGLARALGDVDAQRLTASGLSVGTPHYLSPEQASAEKEVGPKADQYALACVLYEMLVGEPPFTGPTASSIAMRHITETAPLLRTRRKTVPVAVEQAIVRAMEKVPADRFDRIEFFVRANRLTRTSTGRPAAPTAPRGRRTIALVAAIIIMLLGALIAKNRSQAASALDDGWRTVVGKALDTNSLVVVASPADTSSTAVALRDRLRDALARWSDVRVSVAVAVPTMASGSDLIDAAASAARSSQAGRFVIAVTSSMPADSVRLRAMLFDTRRKTLLRDRVVTEGPKWASTEYPVAQLATALMADVEGVSGLQRISDGTTSLGAFNSFLSGEKALQTWNLRGADSAFSRAARIDPSFSQAVLGIARARAWARDEVPELATLTMRALAQPQLLPAHDQLLARALGDLAKRRWPQACAHFDSLLVTDSSSVDALLGLAECSRRDRVVVRSRVHGGRYAFRGSLPRATWAIERVMSGLGEIDSCCGARALELLRRGYAFVGHTQIRFGVSEDGTTTFSAYPGLRADTLVFEPQPNDGRILKPPPTQSDAIQQQREGLLDASAKRVALNPKNAAALELLAEAMELSGSRAAIDTTKRARTLSNDIQQSIRLAVKEVLLRVKFGLPGDLKELTAAKRLADSLLAHSSSTDAATANLLGCVAVLTGRSELAATLAERSAEASASPVPVPLELLGTARSFLAYASVGAPIESLRVLDVRLSDGIANGVAIKQQRMVREMFLERAATIAYPSFQSRLFRESIETDDDLLAAEIAHRNKEPGKARNKLLKLEKARAGLRASDLTFDRLYPEAWLWASLGDSVKALAIVTQPLNAIRNMPVRLLGDISIAGTLVQTMMLRARLEIARKNAQNAAEWTRAARIMTAMSSTNAKLLDSLEKLLLP